MSATTKVEAFERDMLTSDTGNTRLPNATCVERLKVQAEATDHLPDPAAPVETSNPARSTNFQLHPMAISSD